jgi:hypothetical protein
LETEAQKLLMRYNWPGNIRELENTIERAMLIAEGRSIATDDLRLGDTQTAGTGRDQAPVVKIPPTGIPLEDIERHALIEALKMSNWVQKDAAELLAISPRVDELQDQDAGHRVSARPSRGALGRRSLDAQCAVASHGCRKTLHPQAGPIPREHRQTFAHGRPATISSACIARAERPAQYEA